MNSGNSQQSAQGVTAPRSKSISVIGWLITFLFVAPLWLALSHHPLVAAFAVISLVSSICYIFIPAARTYLNASAASIHPACRWPKGRLIILAVISLLIFSSRGKAQREEAVAAEQVTQFLQRAREAHAKGEIDRAADLVNDAQLVWKAPAHLKAEANQLAEQYGREKAKPVMPSPSEPLSPAVAKVETVPVAQRTPVAVTRPTTMTFEQRMREMELLALNERRKERERQEQLSARQAQLDALREKQLERLLAILKRLEKQAWQEPDRFKRLKDIDYMKQNLRNAPDVLLSFPSLWSQTWQLPASRKIIAEIAPEIQRWSREEKDLLNRLEKP